MTLTLVSTASGQTIGTPGPDELFCEDIQDCHLIGLGGDDDLHGGNGDDILEGGEGDDDLSAGGGEDRLIGGPGGDNLFGGDGDDFLDPGPGGDDVRCGGGDDRVDHPDSSDRVSDDCEHIIAGADLWLEKTASPTEVDPGGKVSFTLTVTNLGPDPAQGVTVTDQGVPGFAVAVSSLPSSCSSVGQAVTCESPLISLQDGMAISWTFDATATTEAGTYFNNATASATTMDLVPGNNLDIARVDVHSLNHAPEAGGDAYATTEDMPLSVGAPGVLGNDSDPDGDALTAVAPSEPAHGTLSLAEDGSFTYTPSAGYSGADSFTYRARDTVGAESGPATVTIDVQRAPEPIVFASSRTGNGDLYTLDPAGGPLTQLTSGGAIDAEPAWSPDRTRVAFTSTRDGNVELYVMDADGSNIARLTNNRAVDSSPAWSPDGDRIAFSSSRSGGGDVYSMDSNDGANLIRLTTHSAADTFPAWSPDGARITFSSGRSGNGDIYTMNHDGTDQRRLTSSQGVDTEPDWAAPGIAFSTNRHGTLNFELYKMNPDGTGQTRLTNNKAIDLTPAWSPDGDKLAFATNRHGTLNFELYTIDPSGGSPTRLTTHNALDLFPDW